MKLLRYGPAGARSPACSTPTAPFATCRAMSRDIAATRLDPAALAALAGSIRPACRVAVGNAPLGPCVARHAESSSASA